MVHSNGERIKGGASLGGCARGLGGCCRARNGRCSSCTWVAVGQALRSAMLEGADALLLARIQFAFTVSFHFIFPSFSIGLASYLAVLEALWLRTGKALYLDLFRYWL